MPARPHLRDALRQIWLIEILLDGYAHDARGSDRNVIEPRKIGVHIDIKPKRPDNDLVNLVSAIIPEIVVGTEL